MPSTTQEIAALRIEVQNLNARVLSVTPNQIVPVVVGEYVVFGSLVTEGVSATDQIVALVGQDPGDTANLNPNVSATPARGFEFPNIASTLGGMFASNDTTAVVNAAPATGTGRYDIAYVFAGKEGAGFAIQEGSPSVAVKDDFDTYGLDTSDFGEAHDPALPSGALPVARIYVEDDVTGIPDARIADIRDLSSNLVDAALLVANNLSDVASVATSRTNLGLGTGDSPVFAGLGIGITPVETLHIQDPDPKIRLDDTSSAATIFSQIQGRADGGIRFDGDPDNLGGSTLFDWKLDGSEVMRLDTTGLGIGGTPAVGVHAEGNTDAKSRMRVNATGTGGSNTPGYQLYNEGVFKGAFLFDEANLVTEIWGASGSNHSIALDAAANVDIPNGDFTVSAGFFGGGDQSELTIVAGVVTATSSYHIIDTQADAGTDDLDTINGGSAGDLLTIQSVSVARDPTAKDGTGNLLLAGDFTLTSPQDKLLLIKDSTFWVEVSRSDNA